MRFDDPERWPVALAQFEGKRVVVEIEAERKPGTLKQRGLYWAYLIPALCEHTGYTETEMHDVLKGLFLRAESELPNGQVVKYTRSTESLSSAERAEYHDTAMRWAAAQGWYIPDHDAPPDLLVQGVSEMLDEMEGETT